MLGAFKCVHPASEVKKSRILYIVVELVGCVFVINRAYPVKFFVDIEIKNWI